MMNRNSNIAIYKHTIEYCRHVRFPLFEPLKYKYDSPDFDQSQIVQLAERYDNPAIILVENIDSFDMARKMNGLNGRTLVLNLASNICSGGGVGSGARAQEEDLYRKSNYFEANDPKLYPLAIVDVIYSPLVHIIKDSSYKLLQSPIETACLAVAAIRNPKLKLLESKKETYLFDSDRLVMQNKINMIFKVAIKHGHKDLVLGALGCGVFNNPTEEVARIFKESLKQYGHYFKRVCFAILSPPGNSNYTIFKDVMFQV